MFVWVFCILCILVSSLVELLGLGSLWICVSFSVVNFMVGCLLNSVSISSMFVLFWLYIRKISSTYLKYPIILCFNSIRVNLFVFHVLDICFC
jgi:hypothetical protein